MAFKEFPTEEALDLARIHCDRHARIPHKEVAEDIHEAGLHIDDWAAAVRQLSGIAPGTEEDDENLEAESHIWEVADHYYAKQYEEKRSSRR